MEIVVKIQATAVPLVEKTGTNYLLIFRLTSLLSNYTLKNIQISILCQSKDNYTVKKLSVCNFSKIQILSWIIELV